MSFWFRECNSCLLIRRASWTFSSYYLEDWRYLCIHLLWPPLYHHTVGAKWTRCGQKGYPRRGQRGARRWREVLCYHWQWFLSTTRQENWCFDWKAGRQELRRIKLRFSMTGPRTCFSIGRVQMPTRFCKPSLQRLHNDTGACDDASSAPSTASGGSCRAQQCRQQQLEQEENLLH